MAGTLEAHCSVQQLAVVQVDFPFLGKGVQCGAVPEQQNGVARLPREVHGQIAVEQPESTLQACAQGLGRQFLAQLAGPVSSQQVGLIEHVGDCFSSSCLDAVIQSEDLYRIRCADGGFLTVQPKECSQFTDQPYALVIERGIEA